MTNRKAGIFAAVFCAVGVISAGALAYELQRPLVVPFSESFSSAEHLTSASPASTLNADLGSSTDSPVIELAPMVVVARVSPHRTAVPTTRAVPDGSRDISEMRCSGWRPLEQGPVTQSVRICN
jgi:hypothetical protein